MNYHQIQYDDMVNGEGLRITLFVSGCERKCPDCQNPQTWPFSSGIPFDRDAENELLEAMSMPYIDGLTISGGEPLHPNNIHETARIAKEVKRTYPNKTVWVYTGYLFDQIPVWALAHIDVLVDGMFIKELISPNRPWVGSSNQRVIDVQKSLLENRVALFQGESVNE